MKDENNETTRLWTVNPITFSRIYQREIEYNGYKITWEVRRSFQDNVLSLDYYDEETNFRKWSCDRGSPCSVVFQEMYLLFRKTLNLGWVTRLEWRTIRGRWDRTVRLVHESTGGKGDDDVYGKRIRPYEKDFQGNSSRVGWYWWIVSILLCEKWFDLY